MSSHSKKSSSWMILMSGLLLAGATASEAGEQEIRDKSCSCVHQWLLRAGLSGADAKKYEKSIDSTGLPLSAVGKMSPVVFGLYLGSNTTAARKIQHCLNGLSSKCRHYNPCQQGGICLSAHNGKPSTCRCRKGLTGCLCKNDIDECSSQKLNDCDYPLRAVCTNTHGSYVCSCRKGHSGNGRVCKPINECKQGTHRCHIKAYCIDTVDSYKCRCRKHYSGNGFSCQRDLCADRHSPICKEVSSLTTTVSSLEKALKQQQSQTRLLTSILTQLLTRTTQLETRLIAESAHLSSLRQDMIKLQSPDCSGISSWKHFTKRTTSDFHTWDVTYNKIKKITSLRVTYSGMIGVHGLYGSQWYCTQVDILFNDQACSNPAPITTGYSMRQDNSNWYTRTMSPSVITGHCDGLTNGSLKLTIKVKNACYSSCVRNYNGYSPWSATTYSLSVEELCP